MGNPPAYAYDFDYDEFLGIEPEPPPEPPPVLIMDSELSRKDVFRAIFIGVVLAVVAALVVLTFMPDSDKTQSLAIQWQDQEHVPFAQSDANGRESRAELERTVYRLFFGVPPGTQRFTDVPSDQRVYVLGRIGRGHFRNFTPAGSYSQTCIIEHEGTLTKIAEEDGRALVSYTVPLFHSAYRDDKCSGGEVFFEALG